MTTITTAIAKADAILCDAALPGYSEQLALMKRAVAVIHRDHALTLVMMQLRASLVAHIKLAEPGYVVPGSCAATRIANTNPTTTQGAI